MHASRIQALTRHSAHPGVLSHPRTDTPRRRFTATGPVHRAGPAYHDSTLWEVEDAAAHLLAPATQFHRRVFRLARGTLLLAGCVVMTPALPALFGLA